MFDKCSLLVFLKSNPQFFLGIHDDGAVPRDRLTDGFPRYQKKADRPLLGGNRHLIAIPVQDETLSAAGALLFHVEIVAPYHLVGVCAPFRVKVA
jgi:hypothetical protein